MLLGGALGALGAGCSANNTPRVDTRCTFVPASSPRPPGGAALKAETVADGLEVPWGLAFLPSGDLLVTERPGRVRLLRQGALTPPLLVLPAVEEGEGGLLGIVVDPEFSKNRYFYTYATMRGPDGPENQIERYRLAEDLASATRDKVLLAGIPAGRFHNGGRLRFGPDGMLYVGTGDAQHPELARDPKSLAGKLLRMTRDGEIPADNPTRRSLVYLSGARNVQAFAFAPSGEVLVADHGPSGEMGREGHDEITRAKAGDDLGWPTYYGCEVALGVTAPSLVFEQATPPGGAVLYEGDAIREWKGSLIVATLGSQHLHRVSFARDDPRRVEHHEVYFQGNGPTGLGRLRDVVTGPDGALYVTTSNCDGRGDCPPDGDKIYRITRWSPPPAPLPSPEG
ncbi:PQQ-dependent sugar dehydrogenase [Polyangium spumosum]|uniref:PQQ-dependent sugar dehydrogenase n=1 Tax=Polyangium spumosum TaxID=889282 RepID=UPI0014787984